MIIAVNLQPREDRERREPGEAWIGTQATIVGGERISPLRHRTAEDCVTSLKSVTGLTEELKSAETKMFT